jgi:membrane-bound serine protease (ClpP class)
VILLVGILLALTVVPDPWDIPVVVAFGLIDVAETFITWRLSRRGAPKVGAETLIGAVGSVLTDCAPMGTIRVHGEVWQARSDVPVSAGQDVRVTARDGLTLLVEPI